MSRIQIGQHGHFISDDLESALKHIQNRYNRFYKLLYDYDAGFGHFYHLDDYRKEQILQPFRDILNCPNLNFYRMEKAINDGRYNHYDFFVGQTNNQRQRHGIGFYSWEWEEDDDGDTSITYFIGQYENGVRKEGVWYHLSNEDAKVYVEVENQFRVSAINGLSYLGSTRAIYRDGLYVKVHNQEGEMTEESTSNNIIGCLVLIVIAIAVWCFLF